MSATVTAPPAPAPASRKKPASRTVRVRSSLAERIAPYAYVAPFFIIFLIFGLFPLLFTFYVALFDWNPIGEQTFVGLANFERLLGRLAVLERDGQHVRHLPDRRPSRNSSSPWGSRTC